MIRPTALTGEQKRRSRFFYNLFSFINGISYMCLGETVLILLAVKIAVPDWGISAIAGMSYTGYLMLTTGKAITARVGAAKTQEVCWVIRNFAALLVASAVPLYLGGHPHWVTAAVLTGAFLFYGFRAAGVIMAQPLIGEISDAENRSGFLALSTAVFFFSNVVTLVAVTLLLKFSSSVWMLAGIITFGAVCGLGAARCLTRIDETAALRDSARKPLWPDLIYTLKSDSLRRQITAGFATNLALIMTMPMSMLALKQGYGVSDMTAMVYALVQFGSSAVMSLLTARISEKFGPRKLLIWSCEALLPVGFFWWFAPAEFHPIYCALPFLVTGASSVAVLNATIHYFLQNVEPERRVSVSVFVSVATGAGAGLAGTLVCALLLRFGAACADPALPLSQYRIFFPGVLILLIPCILLTARLKPLPPEKRKLPR